MTSDVAGATAPQPAPQPYDPIRALLRAGKNDEAIVRLCAIVVTRPDDLDAKELLFDAFFQKRDWAPALALAEELARRRPDVARLQKALIATLSNMKRYDESLS
jgi:protein involved in temperature-dependent protein secretion